MTDKNTKLKWIANLLFGIMFRVTLAVPAVLMVLYSSSEYHSLITNVAIFSTIVMSMHGIFLLVVSTLIPPVYAIKTDVSVLEFNMWLPQKLAIYFSAGLVFAGAFLVASQALYWYASVMFLYGIAYLVWPNYVKRIDLASKDDLINKLQGADA